MNIFRALFVIPFVFMVQGYDRTLESHFNPGCAVCNNENVTLLYTKAIGNVDVIHNIWDFTNGKPTIIFAITDFNATLNVEWDNASYTPSAITFSETPMYSFGVILDKIWEFNDVNNTGIFDPSTNQCRSFDTKGMIWLRNSSIQEEGEVMLKVISHEFGDEKRKGNLTIKIDLFPFTSYSFDLPHLVHTSNSSLIDIVLEDMTTSAEYQSSRFALELMVVGTENSNDPMTLIERKGLDDEHTPGVFEILELMTPQLTETGKGGFLQYRPISYIRPEREVASSTKVNTGSLVLTNIAPNTTADKYFSAYRSTFHVSSESFVVSMGDKDDGFYKKTNYNVWCFTAGYGKPPAEGFSLLVILILSIGLGIPLVMLVTGGIYVCAKKCIRQRNRHDILQEE